jgi:hypothetical protein
LAEKSQQWPPHSCNTNHDSLTAPPFLRKVTAAHVPGDKYQHDPVSRVGGTSGSQDVICIACPAARLEKQQ